MVMVMSAGWLVEQRAETGIEPIQFALAGRLSRGR